MKAAMNALCITSILGLAAGCSTPAVDKLEATEPAGSAFNNQLAREYKTLARFEADEMQDFIAAEHFAEKGIKAARNAPTKPDAVSSRAIPEANVANLKIARARLIEAFENDSRERYPLESAAAQASFDCWLEQREENDQPAHIAACRDEFAAALQTMYAKEKDHLANGRQRTDVSRAADRAVPETSPVAGPETTIFFDFDEASIKRTEADKLDRFAADLTGMGSDHTIVVTGHTDRAGSFAYNEDLSVRRAQAVREALASRGIAASAYIVNGKGEMDPAEPTADGVPEADNRRVIVRTR